MSDHETEPKIIDIEAVTIDEETIEPKRPVWTARREKLRALQADLDPQGEGAPAPSLEETLKLTELLRETQGLFAPLADDEDGAFFVPRQEPARRLMSQIATIAAGLAAMIAVAGASTFLMLRPGATSAPVQTAAARAATPTPAVQPAPAATPVVSAETNDRVPMLLHAKDIRMASLSAEDAAGYAAQTIPLDIHALPATPGQQIGVKLSGLPELAELSAGTKLGDGAWMLRPEQLPQLSVKMPETAQGEVPVAVEAIDLASGEAATPERELTVTVQPVSDTPPPARAQNFNVAPASPPSPEVMALMVRGNELLAAGDILTARRYFERAVKAGERSAMLALGMTYDPATFTRFKVRGGLKPDPQSAREWYAEARAAGISGAADRLAGLPPG